MVLFDSANAAGDIVTMKTTNARHLKPGLSSLEKDVLESGAKPFSEVLGSALNSVNKLQQESAEISQLMITDPDKVDVHDVTIAMGKANLAVSITKAVVDGAVKAYKEIINMR